MLVSRWWQTSTRRTKQTVGFVACFIFVVVLTYYSESPWRRNIGGVLRESDDGAENGEKVIIMDADGKRKIAEFVNTPDDKDAQLESDIYLQNNPESDEEEEEGDDEDEGGVPRESGSSQNDSWPTRNDDYSPVSKGTIARLIFKDLGKTLLQTSKNYKSPGTRQLTKEEKSKGIHVITTFFHGSYELRRFSEIVAALVSNLENPYISFVHCLYEKEDPTQHVQTNAPHLLPKLVAVEVKAQPTYAKLFRYANENLERGSLAIVTNADIYFDSALRCLSGPDPSIPVDTIPNKQRTVFALSRRHTTLCGKRADHGSVLDLCQDYVHSHDAFIFAPPVPQELIKKTNHLQNRYGGENIVVWEFTLLGYRVMNPCKKVHAIHLHCSQERHYVTRFIDGYRGNGPYRHGTVWPGTVRTDVSRKGWKPGGILPCGVQLN